MKLYIYDHCPFCVRPRLVAGLRGVKLEEVILLNDDEDNPIRMVGAKQVPILEKDDGTFMPESLDIVLYLDEYAGQGRLNENVRPEVPAWLAKVGGYYNKLTQPRLVQNGLPEFATEAAVAYFVGKKEPNIGNFAENIAQTEQYLAALHADLAGLVALMADGSDGLNGEVGMEDVLVFPVLRNLTVVKAIEWPPRVWNYVNTLAQKSGVNLYSEYAV